ADAPPPPRGARLPPLPPPAPRGSLRRELSPRRLLHHARTRAGAVAGTPSSAQPPRLARHLARAPPPGPPSPETGVARRPAYGGRLTRRGRPALRGALRLVGFAPDGIRTHSH